MIKSAELEEGRYLPGKSSSGTCNSSHSIAASRGDKMLRASTRGSLVEEEDEDFSLAVAEQIADKHEVMSEGRKARVVSWVWRVERSRAGVETPDGAVDTVEAASLLASSTADGNCCIICEYNSASTREEIYFVTHLSHRSLDHLSQ